MRAHNRAFTAFCAEAKLCGWGRPEIRPAGTRQPRAIDEAEMFPEGLRREVIAVLCVKLLALVVILHFLIHTGPGPDSAAMRAHLLTDGI
jgi:hypothetical protein